MRARTRALLNKSWRKHRLLCGSFWACLLSLSSAFAQTAHNVTCPGLDNDAAAAEQSVCWFNNDKAGLPICAVNKNDANPCITQTNAWCAHASLDEDIVTTACMMAAIRVGKLTEAKEIAKYLRSPSPSAAVCVAALKRATLRIVTNPAGAEIIVNGRSYGKSPIPVEPSVTGPWWKSKVTVVFTSYGWRSEAEVSLSELLDAFDKRECVFGDLIVADPNDPNLATLSLTPETPAPMGMARSLTPQAIKKRSKTILWSSIALAGAGVASSATAIGLFANGKRDQYQLGNIFLITGSVCLVNAMVLYFLNGNAAE
jgi:hypothetical protein